MKSVLTQYVEWRKAQGEANVETGEEEIRAAKLVDSYPEHVLRLATVMAGVVDRNKIRETKEGKKK